MKKRLLGALLSAGLLVGTLAPAQSVTQPRNAGSHTHRQSHFRRGSAARHIGTGALGGAAIGGFVGGGRGALIGGAAGAGVGGIRHRSRHRIRHRRHNRVR